MLGHVLPTTQAHARTPPGAMAPSTRSSILEARTPLEPPLPVGQRFSVRIQSSTSSRN